MLSRIFWAGVAGIAIIAGMAWQNDGIFSWDDHDPIVSVKSDRSIDERVDRAIETGIGKMEVVGSDGQEINVPAETKRALAEAVGRLVKAETDLALVKIRDGSENELKAAEGRRSQARADVERLKQEIERLDKSSSTDGDEIAQDVRQQIRDEVRAEIRDAVRN
jgi:hypothetical protein